MKTIIFVRHAKSSWANFNLSDFDRPLDSRGLKDAPVMAEKLRSFKVLPDLIISSPANRALSTAQYFADEFQIEITTEKDLYHGYPENYLDALTEFDESIKTVALFGHNPGLTHVANLIESGCTDNLPTCGIIIAQVPDDVYWNNIQFSDMKLIHLLYPKM